MEISSYISMVCLAHQIYTRSPISVSELHCELTAVITDHLRRMRTEHGSSRAMSSPGFYLAVLSWRTGQNHIHDGPSATLISNSPREREGKGGRGGGAGLRCAAHQHSSHEAKVCSGHLPDRWALSVQMRERDRDRGKKKRRAGECGGGGREIKRELYKGHHFRRRRWSVVLKDKNAEHKSYTFLPQWSWWPSYFDIAKWKQISKMLIPQFSIESLTGRFHLDGHHYFFNDMASQLL